VTAAVGGDNHNIEKIISFFLLFAVAWEIEVTNNIRCFWKNVSHLASLTATESSEEEPRMSKRKKKLPTTYNNNNNNSSCIICSGNVMF
jgi:hypothetical protein